MNNHVHLLAVPQISESLSRALGRIHSATRSERSWAGRVAEKFQWSSARAHATDHGDGVVEMAPCATTTSALAGGKLYAWAAWMKRLCRTACDRLRALVTREKLGR
jgi:hypothetical protein